MIAANEAAVLLVIAGLALDALVTQNFATVFPNTRSDSISLIAANEAAVLLVIAGLALDALVTQNFAAVFPNLAASALG